MRKPPRPVQARHQVTMGYEATDAFAAELCFRRAVCMDPGYEEAPAIDSKASDAHYGLGCALLQGLRDAWARRSCGRPSACEHVGSDAAPGCRRCDAGSARLGWAVLDDIYESINSSSAPLAI